MLQRKKNISPPNEWRNIPFWIFSSFPFLLTLNMFRISIQTWLRPFEATLDVMPFSSLTSSGRCCPSIVRGNLPLKTLLMCTFIIDKWWKTEWGDPTNTGNFNLPFFKGSIWRRKEGFPMVKTLLSWALTDFFPKRSFELGKSHPSMLYDHPM